MYNWSVDTKELKKDKEKYAIWSLEQMANFGLEEKKLSAKNLKKYWTRLNIDPARKRYLALLLWGKKSLQLPKNK